MNDVEPESKGNYLFLDEPPLIFFPSLALAIGVDKAIIVQQLQCLVENTKGTKWICNSYKDLQKQFPFWSISHIRRMINDLEINGILISRNFNKVKSDRTKWYTINWRKIERLVAAGGVGNLSGLKVEQRDKDSNPDPANSPLNQTSNSENTVEKQSFKCSIQIKRGGLNR